MRDAEDYGFGLSFEDAVKKARSEHWSDRDIAVMLGCREDEVARVPVEKVAINLEDLKFRPDAEGGRVIEFLVDGRKKTQAVPLMVGDILEAVVKDMVELKSAFKEHISERPASTTRGN